jgi:ribosomal protein L5
VSAASATEQAYVPRLKQRYNEELRESLKEQLGLESIMQAPTISKITLNMGVGEGKTDAKQIDAALDELTTIAGQRAQVRRARKSIAQFKVREGMTIGVKVTLRGDRMWEFLDRLVSIALPRIRDFRGLSPESFASRSSSRRSTTTASARSAASTSRSRPPQPPTRRRGRFLAGSGCRSRRKGQGLSRWPKSR